MKHWRFYHFCSEKNMKAARNFGITEGVLPLQVIPDPRNLKQNTFRYMKEIQWLTKNPDFIPMDADRGPPKSSLLPGRKSEYRITVDIPDEGRGNICDWLLLSRRMKNIDDTRPGVIKLQESLEREINIDLINPADWWLFGGSIPQKWFRDVRKNPCLPPDIIRISAMDSQIFVPKTSAPDVLGHAGEVHPDIVTGFDRSGAK